MRTRASNDVIIDYRGRARSASAGLVRRPVARGVAGRRPRRSPIDREEITVRLTVPDVELGEDSSEVARAEARAGRAKAFREETRGQRMEIAREAEHRYDAKVSLGPATSARATTSTPSCGPTSPRR